MLEYDGLSLLPSLIAIIFAIVTRQVYVSLFLGVWSGAWLLAGAEFSTLFPSFLRVVDTHLVQALVPESGATGHMSVAIFTLCIGGMIGVISRSGGLQGVVQMLSCFATSARRAEWITFGFGGVVFFDGYANTLIVGNAMRPITEKMGVAREKLAYIVDSTSSPMASVGLVTTWIGFQISLIYETLGADAPAFEMMLGAVGYSFYPILTLIFVALLIHTRRDFGPMSKVKNIVHNDKKEHQLNNSECQKNKSYLLAVLPILTLVVGTFAGIYVTGEGDALHEVFGSADSFRAMMWASFASLAVAIMLSAGVARMKIAEVMEAMEQGMQPMFGAVIVLTFAWAIAGVNKDLQTAEYIISWLDNISFSAGWVPVMLFILAALCSFSTGTSWGTMGIMMPLAMPLAMGAAELPLGSAEIYAHPIMLASLAAVMGGATWGDHCSPISDTTILSSMASGCEHAAHVRTQLPYALVVSVVAVTFGMIPTLILGVPLIISFVLCAMSLYLIIRIFGEK